jgi:hypothetical protein
MSALFSFTAFICFESPCRYLPVFLVKSQAFPDPPELTVLKVQLDIFQNRP